MNQPSYRIRNRLSAKISSSCAFHGGTARSSTTRTHTVDRRAQCTGRDAAPTRSRCRSSKSHRCSEVRTWRQRRIARRRSLGAKVRERANRLCRTPPLQAESTDRISSRLRLLPNHQRHDITHTIAAASNQPTTKGPNEKRYQPARDRRRLRPARRLNLRPTPAPLSPFMESGSNEQSAAKESRRSASAAHGMGLRTPIRFSIRSGPKTAHIPGNQGRWPAKWKNGDNRMRNKPTSRI